VAASFQRGEIEQAILPEKHIGMAKELSRRTVAFVQSRMQELGDAPAAGCQQRCPLCAEDSCQALR